jgi:hypothetical protein
MIRKALLGRKVHRSITYHYLFYRQDYHGFRAFKKQNLTKKVYGVEGVFYEREHLKQRKKKFKSFAV